jgi:hypothetical protein
LSEIEEEKQQVVHENSTLKNVVNSLERTVDGLRKEMAFITIEKEKLLKSMEETILEKDTYLARLNNEVILSSMLITVTDQELQAVRGATEIGKDKASRRHYIPKKSSQSTLQSVHSTSEND